jgi:hypothetical protein
MYHESVCVSDYGAQFQTHFGKVVSDLYIDADIPSMQREISVAKAIREMHVTQQHLNKHKVLLL